MRALPILTSTALAFFVLATSVDARERPMDKANKPPTMQGKAAGCAPAQTLTQFWFNNVRTGAETSGTVWYNRLNSPSAPYYEVPAGGGVHALYDGSLWLGGEDPAGNLKLAAVRFRQIGNDYWPGPLTVDGTASTDPETCLKWDRHFMISKVQVETHRYYFTLLASGVDPGTDPLFENGYTIPEEILQWPAHGDVTKNQSYLLAPFVDFVDADGVMHGTAGVYEPSLGDYPAYDLDKEVDCNSRLVTDPVPLFGDFTMYWIFNDKGNIHTESQGEAIGMEIQAQMFAFATNDEINSMTFINYVLINRGSLTLTNTYFGKWVDSDLGFAGDDYIGCDVQRGLGYSYNGDSFDEPGDFGGYGVQPPAIGVDFFEGPYQDPDNINNAYGIGEGQAINGLGYYDPTDLNPDSIVDNERFGMRRFLYHNNASGPMGDPDVAVEYYNYLRGIWADGTPMTYGGNGYNSSNIVADFMFPGDSDPLHWGTEGVDPGFAWTEEGVGNAPGDRRFIQSAGPFTLDPGEFNNITVGVVYGRAQTGGPMASVNVVLNADDKAQALFENCFRLLSGPDAPDLTAQELDQKVILYLGNTSSLSNNRNEAYTEIDPTIPEFNEVDSVFNDQFYKFQGYQVYQLKNAEISVGQLGDESVARLVAQMDIEDYDELGNPIGNIVNYVDNEETGLPVPQLMVKGSNEGIVHSLEITEDLFASGGNTRLVNFKKYYYVAIAYGYNNYKQYNPLEGTGQPSPYLRGRTNATGGEIKPITVIPHKPAPELYGTEINAEYGDGVEITRIEGRGNGANQIQLTQRTIDKIMDGEPYKADTLDYVRGAGPVNIKVIDPLNVKEAKFRLNFYDWHGNSGGGTDQMGYYLVDINNPGDTIWSDTLISVRYEQLLPEYGISITLGRDWSQSSSENTSNRAPRLLGSNITYGSNAWLVGVPDIDGRTPQNWIRSGVQYTPGGECEPATAATCWVDETTGEVTVCAYNDIVDFDNNEIYETVLGGSWAPAAVVAADDCRPAPHSNTSQAQTRVGADLRATSSVEVFITPDKSKWTRSPVLELHHDQDFAENRAKKMFMRNALSVDKNGRNQLDPEANIDEITYYGAQALTQENIDAMADDEVEAILESYNLSSESELIGMSLGMGWFPGYAIDPSTGERLNIAFGEDSYLAGDNGRDMLWNPSNRVATESQVYTGAGQHYIYIFRNEKLRRSATESNVDPRHVGMYDGAQKIYENMYGNALARLYSYRAIDWIGYMATTGEFPYLSPEDGLVPGEVHISISVGQPYNKYATLANELGTDSKPFVPTDQYHEMSSNDWYPSYYFTTTGLQTVVQHNEVAKNALDLINIVPNPYYAYSAYETSRIDNVVKFTNLPPECTINIYTLNGTLVRKLQKDNLNTWLEWDLRNQNFIPVAGGVYLIHVSAPDIGERVLKFFMSTRPADVVNY